MNADAACAAAHTKPVFDEQFVYTNSTDGTMTIGNVFVHLKGDLSGTYSAPDTPVVLDQKGCRYTPHVLGMMTGHQLLIKNPDPTAHNVHSLARKNNNFNNGQTQGAPALSKSFANEEVMIKIKCDMHIWMTCYAGVLSHPFFDVTGIEGTFAIDEVPAGEDELGAWQELLGTQSKKVIVEKDQTARVEFVFEKH